MYRYRYRLGCALNPTIYDMVRMTRLNCNLEDGRQWISYSNVRI